MMESFVHMQGPTSAHDKILAPPLTTKIFWEDIIKAAGLANPSEGRNNERADALEHVEGISLTVV